MTSGSINCSPDYKSNKFSDYLAEQMKDPEFAAAYNEISAVEDKKLAEIRRLEREVIEACKAEREAQKTYLERLNFITSEAHHNALIRRTSAVDALIDFESQIKR